MPRILSTLARRTAAGGLILLLALTSLVPAQVEKVPARQSTLCILVQVKNQGYKAKEIEETLAEGAGKKGYKYSQIRAVVLKPETLAEMQRVISNLESARATGASGKPIITQKATDAVLEWEFNLNIDEPGVVLRKMEINFKDGAKEKAKEFELKINPKPNDPLVRTAQPGVYTVSLPSTEVPISYVAHYQSLKSREGKTISGLWPTPEKSFLVTVKDFEGDYKELLNFVRRIPGTKQNVANPLDDVEPGPDIAMVFASVGFKLRRTGITLDENHWVPVVQGIEDTDSDRVWMLFPLTREEAEKKLAAYRELGPGDLAKKIRNEKPIWSKETREITINEQELSPSWIELPKSGEKGFSRELRIKDARALYKKLPEAYRLIVYELGTPEVSYAQAVQDPVSGGRVFIISEAIKEWPEGIKEAATKAKDK